MSYLKDDRLVGDLFKVSGHSPCADSQHGDEGHEVVPRAWRPVDGRWLVIVQPAAVVALLAVLHFFIIIYAWDSFR